jgi:hypothetical protein
LRQVAAKGKGRVDESPDPPFPLEGAKMSQRKAYRGIFVDVHVVVVGMGEGQILGARIPWDLSERRISKIVAGVKGQVDGPPEGATSTDERYGGLSNRAGNRCPGRGIIHGPLEVRIPLCAHDIVRTL